MLIGHEQGQPTHTQLYGLNGAVHWPTFFSRTLVRGLILWPIVRFLGGSTGARGIATAVVGGAAFTGIEMAYDATHLLAAQQAAVLGPMTASAPQEAAAAQVGAQAAAGTAGFYGAQQPAVIDLGSFGQR
jgi:hypothetical protein